MNSFTVLAGLLVFTLVLNLPFGYLRSRARKYSIMWFLYIHMPIPIIIFLRMSLGFTWAAIPLVVLAAVTGQYAGGKIGQK